MLSAGPISHNSIHLLIITTVLSHFTDLLDMPFSLSLHFLPVLSLETSVCSTLKFVLFLWGHNEYKIVFSVLLIYQLKCRQRMCEGAYRASSNGSERSI